MYYFLRLYYIVLYFVFQPCEDKLELEVALDELNEQPYSKEFIIDVSRCS